MNPVTYRTFSLIVSTSHGQVPVLLDMHYNGRFRDAYLPLPLLMYPYENDTSTYSETGHIVMVHRVHFILVYIHANDEMQFTKRGSNGTMSDKLLV